MTVWRLSDDEKRCQERKGAPRDLSGVSEKKGPGEGLILYHCGSLNAEEERIREHVSRVRQCILLP